MKFKHFVPMRKPPPQKKGRNNCYQEYQGEVSKNDPDGILLGIFEKN